MGREEERRREGGRGEEEGEGEGGERGREEWGGDRGLDALEGCDMHHVMYM